MLDCPMCGYPNRNEARWCSQCGAVLAGEPAVASLPVSVGSPQPPAPLAPPAPAPRQTRPLAAQEFHELPVGALLQERRYVIAKVLSFGEKLNTYLAESFRGEAICQTCRTLVTPQKEKFCPSCGTEFARVAPAPARFGIKETPDRDMFAKERVIAAQRLDDPGLVRLHEYFEASFAGAATRYYMVYEEAELAGQPLDEVQPAPSLEQVLTWGGQLAHALAYLRARSVFLRTIASTSIVIVEGQARLRDFRYAEHFPKPPPARDAREWEADSVRKLTRVLYRALTGRADFTPDPALPPPAGQVFEAVLGSRPSVGTAAELAQAFEAARTAIAKPPAVQWQVVGQSDVGVIRQLNEDSVAVLDFEQLRESVSQRAGLFVVADGMGGHSAGETASQAAIATVVAAVIKQVWLPRLEGKAEPDYRAALTTAVQQANKAIFDQSRAQRNDMGTTTVAALVIGATAYIANVGDSRAYLVDGGTVQQITRDHSLVERLVEMGQITREEARVHPDRNYITRHLGEKANVEVDTFVQPLRSGQRLLLCSDGLNSMITDEEIRQVMAAAPHPQAAARGLIEAAKIAGGEDNVSVIVLDVM